MLPDATRHVGEVRRFEGHTESVHSVSFSPDRRLALSGSVDGSVRVWDVETGRCGGW